ncbi:MAG: hypothetical protein ABJA80_05740 [bacterium]
MFNASQTWIDAFLVLRTEALGARGFDAACGERYPRTTNVDVMMMAAIFDPFVRTYGSDGLELRWRELRDELARALLADPHDTYARNALFWSTLESAIVYFDERAIEPPATALWDGLVVQLRTSPERRNAGPQGDGPFEHFEAKTFDDLYLAQYQYLRDLRGADTSPPEAGTMGFPKPIPRSTNADVLALTKYWTAQLASVPKVFGHEAVEKKWKETADTVAATATKADPNAVYPHNNAFWRVLGTTTTHIATADEAPGKAGMFLDSVVHSIEALPGRVADVVGDGARVVAKVGGAAAAGFLGAFKTPLLIGGGLLAVYLLARD